MVSCIAVAVVANWVASARADVILGQHDWDSGPETGWASTPSITTLDGDGNPTWLKITFPAVDPESDQDLWHDVVNVQAENLFAGTWTSDMSVGFNFFAEDVMPNALQVVLKSTDSATIWGVSLTPTGSTGVWTHYEVKLNNPEFWTLGSEGEYLDDLSTIDWLGVYIDRTGAGAQDYGLDDVTLSIPEPPEVIMLGSAILLSLSSLRRRRKTT